MQPLQMENVKNKFKSNQKKWVEISQKFFFWQQKINFLHFLLISALKFCLEG